MVAAALPLSIAVNANSLDAVGEVCGPALGCGPSDVLGQVLLLVAFGVLTAFVLAAVQRVSAARAAVGEERSRTATERDAFDRFARTVAGLDPSRGSYQVTAGAGGAAAATVAGTAPSDGRLEAVREAYRESVMTMPHYEEEYDEPLGRHLSGEFGEEVATAVTEGERLTPGLQQVLVERAREAARERDRLMRRLDSEVDALEAAGDELRSVESAVRDAERRSLDELGFRGLADEWNRLGELEARLGRLLTDRQSSLRAREGRAGGRAESLVQYLYADLATDHPVLVDGTVLLDRVKGARSRVLGRLASRA